MQAFAAGLLSAFAHSPTFAVRDYGGEVRLGSTAESLEVELTGHWPWQPARSGAESRQPE